jgi:glycosyltransferase involved in cell wall biosynthesis
MTLEYVLITPARNEAELIENTLRSVVAQTHLPKRWVIVSDGSTDGTDELVRKYQAGRPWLELVRMPERKERHFAAKVNAFQAGYARVKDLDFDVVGNLDADVSFDPDYMEYLVGRFEGNPRLGVAGTHYIEGDFHSYRDSYINVEHVNGQIQMFRRACWEEIGGYVPNKGGGIDWVAVTTARMKGWKTYSFGERTFNHHRKMGTAGSSEIKARFHYGKKDYFLGGHPLWQVARGTFQLAKKPYVVGGLALMLGYAWYWVSGAKRAVSPELMAFHRGEQMARLKDLLARRIGLRRDSPQVAASKAEQ